MIYLIKQLSWNPDHCIFKPGYSDDLDKRVNQYLSCCPTTLLISSRFGEHLEELIVHTYLHGLNGIKFIKSEWYEVPNDRSDWFINEFSKSYDDMEKYLLENLAFISNKSLKNYLLGKYYPDNNNTPDPDLSNIDPNIQKSYLEYIEIKNASDRLEYLCDDEERANELMKVIPNIDKARNLYDTFGYFICEFAYFDIKLLSKSMNKGYSIKESITEKVKKTFEVGKRYTCNYIEEILQSIYKSYCSYKKTAKATDLDEYLILKPCKVQDLDGKWQKGFEIISIK